MSDTAGLALGYISISLTFLMMLVSIVTLNRNKASYLIWHFISWIYLIRWYPLLNILASPTTQSIAQGFISAFIPFAIATYTNPCSVPTSFFDAGITNPYFLNNLNVPLVIWVVTLLLYLSILSLRCSKFDTLRRSACENLIIRSTLILFSEFCIFSFLQIIEFEISTWYGIMNSILAVTFTICLFLVLGFLTFNIHYRMQKKTEEAIVRLKTVLEEFKRDSFKQWLYYSIFMFERLMIAAAFTFFEGMLVIQTMIIVFIHAAKMGYLLAIKPFSKNIDNFTVAGLEFLSIIIVTLIVSGTSNQMSVSSKDNLAWVNFVIVIFGNVVMVIAFVSRLLDTVPESEVHSAENRDDMFNHTNIESSANIITHKKTFNENGERYRKGSVYAEEEFRNEGRKSNIKLQIGNKSSIFSIHNLGEDRNHDPLPDIASEINERIPYYTSLFNKYVNKNK